MDTLEKECEGFQPDLLRSAAPKNGIIHVVGPETGLTQPGMTIVCGDSHTSTHGAMGAIAFGIGTSEVEMTLATQCIMQRKPKTMRITIDGQRKPGVTAKDFALYIISKMTTGGATGYFVEYAGEAIRQHNDGRTSDHLQPVYRNGCPRWYDRSRPGYFRLSERP